MSRWLILEHLQRPKWEPKSTKWRQNGIKIFVADPPKRVLGKTLVSLCILVSILVTGGTLLVPNGQLLFHFWCYFWEHVLRLLGTLRARRIDHVLLQNYLGVFFIFQYRSYAIFQYRSYSQNAAFRNPSNSNRCTGGAPNRAISLQVLPFAASFS